MAIYLQWINEWNKRHTTIKSNSIERNVHSSMKKLSIVHQKNQQKLISIKTEEIRKHRLNTFTMTTDGNYPNNAQVEIGHHQKCQLLLVVAHKHRSNQRILFVYAMTRNE